MEIKSISRPWIKQAKRNKGKNDAFYQSSTWRNTKKSFKASEPTIQLKPIFGIPYDNHYCADCWEEGKINSEKIEIDHVLAIDDGGDETDQSNLRSRCHKHHNRKTHEERKKRLNHG